MNNINYQPPIFEQFQDFIERLYPQRDNKKIRTITFQVTEDCCMKCTYCYQNNKSKNKMTFETAKKIIDKLLNDELEIANIKNTFGIIIDFIGGEPLMEIELIEQIINYTLKSMIEVDHPWLFYTKFSICSNGLLYNTLKVQEFFNKYNKLISFTISIDGNKELHDSCRIDLQGNGTYDRVIESIHSFFKQYGYIPSTKMTLSPSNITYLKKATINLIKEGYREIPMNCIFEKGWNNSHAKILYDEMKEIADYLIYNNLYNKVNFSLFNETFFSPMDESENDNWCGGTADEGFAVDYNGLLYPCLRYMDSSLNHNQKKLNIGSKCDYLTCKDEKDNYKLLSNITRRSQSTDECFYCPIAFGCSWCSAYNYEEFGTPNKRATYICCMHKARALANVYYWNTLYKYLGINKIFKMHIPKEWALEIIDEEEYNYLKNLQEG